MTSTRKRCDLYSLRFYATVILLLYFASAYTDPLNVEALEDLYGLLNQPTMLTGWMATGGDPCGQNWTGVPYSGSSMISIKISRLGQEGTMSSQLSSFHSLSQLEIWEVDQYLVQYGSPYLHDLESLQRTADPTISREVLTGAGPIGSLFPDGQVLAVKRLAVVQMESLEGEEEFLDLVSTMSDLKDCNLHNPLTHCKFDSEIWEVEQYLVRYGSPYLHGLESLRKSADPTISREVLTGAGPINSLFPDGQVLAVKMLEVVQMELFEAEEVFLDLVSTMSDLKHRNICILQSYYARNGSLYSALFSNNGDSQKPLSWKLRLKIALRAACSLEYMHEICSPPIANGIIKARNVLLDEEFVPHFTGFGLTMLSHILPATSVDFKMFEGSKGYTAPEMSIPGSDMIKGDIFSFGVLLLKLLGVYLYLRRPSRPGLLAAFVVVLVLLPVAQVVADNNGKDVPPNAETMLAIYVGLVGLMGTAAAIMAIPLPESTDSIKKFGKILMCAMDVIILLFVIATLIWGGYIHYRSRKSDTRVRMKTILLSFLLFFSCLAGCILLKVLAVTLSDIF